MAKLQQAPIRLEMDNKIQQFIELMSQNQEELQTLLSGYSVKQLEYLAGYLDHWSWYKEEIPERTPEHKLLTVVLKLRKRKLDAEFELTPIAIEKIRSLDQQLMECLKMYAQKRKMK
jgi:hypothetical protein